MIHQITKQKNNGLPITSLFCLIVFVSISLPIMRGEAERDEATVAAQWTFDDGSVNDISGNNINGQPNAVEGIYDKALEFDGVDDGIKLPDTPFINTDGPYSDRKPFTMMVLKI